VTVFGRSARYYDEISHRTTNRDLRERKNITFSLRRHGSYCPVA